MKFRHDINALRSIAVLSVVIFHFYPNILPGGFVGVDIFFVISGFLMTKIIYSRLSENRFDLIDFYQARIYRIVPVLMFVVFTVLTICYYSLDLVSFLNVIKHALSTIFFFSNFVYTLESGYFDSESVFKWLLHTWSLSVEWQFYIIFPFFLIILKRIFNNVNRIYHSIILVTIISFILSVFFSIEYPSYSYYLLPSRAWELLFGGVAYFSKGYFEKFKNLDFFGYFLLFLSLFIVDRNDMWPGMLTLIPVFGTYIVIVSNKARPFLVNNKIISNLGLSSYSIYLWHWPIVVWINYFGFSDFRTFGFALSIIIGLVSCIFIEQNAKGFIVKINKLFDFNYSFEIVWLISFMLACVSYFYIKDFIYSHPEKYESSFIGTKFVVSGKLVDSKDGDVHTLNSELARPVDYLLIGDSNSAHYSYGIVSENKYKIRHEWVGSCLALPNYTTKPYSNWMNDEWLSRCKNLHNLIFENDDLPIILAQNWVERPLLCFSGDCAFNNNDYWDILNDQIRILSQSINHTLVIIGQIPIPESMPYTCLRNINRNMCSGDITNFSDNRIFVNQQLSKISSHFDNVVFINPFDAICVDDICPVYSHKEGLIFDTNHLTGYGSKVFWNYISQNLPLSTD
jgi:peptidoglycan/LPS O-acetylase OafA/YrhL